MEKYNNKILVSYMFFKHSRTTNNQRHILKKYIRKKRFNNWSQVPIEYRKYYRVYVYFGKTKAWLKKWQVCLLTSNVIDGAVWL